jgi:hypothetical protein
VNAITRLERANPIPMSSIADLEAALPELRRDLTPGPPARRPRRRLAVACVAAAAIAVGAPAIALGTSLPQTIGDFFGSNAPPQAKATLTPLVRRSLPPGIGHVDAVHLAISAHGPEGEVQLYALQFDNGNVGTSIVDATNTPPHVSAVNGGPPRPLAAGQVFDVRGAGGSYPGQRPTYFAGIVAPQVARVELVQQRGTTQEIATSGGYMLGWISPDADHSYGDGQLLAYDAAGNELGRIDECDIGPSHDVQFRQHTAGMPDAVAAACALPPPHDPG